MRIRGVLLGLVLAGQAVGAEPTMSAPIPQLVELGDSQVESAQPVVLRLPQEVWDRIGVSLQEAARVPTSLQSTSIVTGGLLLLHWQAPEKPDRTIVIQEPHIELPVTTNVSCTYRYWLEAKGPGGHFELRMPASPGTYRVEAELSLGPTIVEGPGDLEGVFGETIPVKISLSDRRGIQEVVLHHRSHENSPWTTAAMKLSNGSEQSGCWVVSLLRPLGREVTIEYYVVVSGGPGRVTRYGVADKPRRIKLLPPQLPQTADQ